MPAMPDTLEWAEPPRAKRRRLKASHVREVEDYVPEVVVVTAPWGDCEVFTSPRKARKFKRRHRREIESNFSY